MDDCYTDGGLGGLFSQEFIEAVCDETIEYFSLLPTSLTRSSYYFLRCEEVVDFFDRANAKFDTFKWSTDIKKFHYYASFPDRLPQGKLFRIPETKRLSATDDVRRRVEEAQLQGVEFLKLP